MHAHESSEMVPNRAPFIGEPQYVALAVADSLEKAQAAAGTVKVIYKEERPDVGTKLTPQDEPKVGSQRGDAEAAFDSAQVKVDRTYVTPVETHNPIKRRRFITPPVCGSENCRLGSRI